MSDFANRIAREIPYLRRYARALTGDQQAGDDLAMQTLEAILADRSLLDNNLMLRTALYRAFHKIWMGHDMHLAPSQGGSLGKAMEHLAKLAPNTREALILSTIEQMSTRDIALVIDVTEDEVRGLLKLARNDLHNNSIGSVLIIEDETLIAQDLTSLVTGLGHTVTGVARTKGEALEQGLNQKPELILADIQLADDTSGIDAVIEILAQIGDVPVIYVTAYPERLLTGKRLEPAFLIPKPYQESHVQSAVSQAMFFASTNTLIRH